MFALLVFEMALFCALLVPMPFKMKRKMFTFISENPLVARLQYGLKVGLIWILQLRRCMANRLKITFIFIVILFVDSVNRVYRVQMELSSVQKGNAGQ